jgi:hypothetical protein
MMNLLGILVIVFSVLLFSLIVMYFLFFLPAYLKAITGVKLTLWQKFCYKGYYWCRLVFVIIKTILS